MKKIISQSLLALTLLLSLINLTGCTDEYKDMQPGEVRLQKNDFRNDDQIQNIQYPTENGTLTMNAFEVRTIWHAIIANAEDKLEKDDNGRKLYNSPEAAKEEFNLALQNSMLKMIEEYPQANNAIMEELNKAEVKVYIEYVWCVQPKEYTELKFEVTPNTAYPKEN